MTSDDAAAHLKRYFALWMTHDAENMAALYAPDAAMEDPTRPDGCKGRTEIRAYYADMYTALENPAHELVDYAVNGRRVWFRWTLMVGGSSSSRRAYQGISIQALDEEGLIEHDYSSWDPR